MPDTELKLRRLLAFSYGGPALYADDGELQDGSELPAIDFLRDSPDTIRHKMQERGINRYNALKRP